MSKVIRRNATKKINALAARVTEIKVYSLDNNFSGNLYVGEKTPLELINSYLEKFRHTTLRQDNETALSMQIHSNLWFVFVLKSETETAVAELIEENKGVLVAKEAAPVKAEQTADVKSSAQIITIEKKDVATGGFIVRAESIGAMVFASPTTLSFVCLEKWQWLEMVDKCIYHDVKFTRSMYQATYNEKMTAIKQALGNEHADKFATATV